MNPETKRGSGRQRPLRASDPGFAPMRAGCGGVIELHIWNEQFPCFSAGGATLSWGRQISRRVDTSLRELARHLAASRADLERRYGTPQKLEGVGNSTCERLISVPQSMEPSPPR